MNEISTKIDCPAQCLLGKYIRDDGSTEVCTVCGGCGYTYETQEFEDSDMPIIW